MFQRHFMVDAGINLGVLNTGGKGVVVFNPRSNGCGLHRRSKAELCRRGAELVEAICVIPSHPRKPTVDTIRSHAAFNRLDRWVKSFVLVRCAHDLFFAVGMVRPPHCSPLLPRQLQANGGQQR